MSTHRLLERARAASQLPLRRAYVERQAREFGACICGAPTVLHFAGEGCAGAFLGCAIARELEAGAQQLAGVLRQHDAESLHSARTAKGQIV